MAHLFRQPLFVVVPSLDLRSDQRNQYTSPQRIVLELESDSDSTSLYATPIDSTARQRARRLGLLLPVWSVQSLLGKPLDVSVYLDPATNQPVAFRTAKGMLWCLLPWQSVV